MLRGFLYALLILFWIGHELLARKGRGLRPASFRELLLFAKKGESPHAYSSALIFSFLSLVLFAFWELILSFLLDREAPWWTAFLAFAAYTGSLALRRHSLSKSSDPALKREDVILLLGFAVLFPASCLGLLLSPWVLWRARFLKWRTAK